MKRSVLSLSFVLCAGVAGAQITITAADMPVSGDTLRSSLVAPTTSINLTNTGANTTWDFSGLVPVSQAVDHYQTAGQIDPAYGAAISGTAYGYKVADTFDANGASVPIAITDVYTFFNIKSSPSSFVAEAFAAKLSGSPTPINYSDEDEWYFFPLQFNDVDNSTFRLSYTLAPIGSFSQTGTRQTTVDGWGTIKTPHFTTPVNCIRVKTEINENDTIVILGSPTILPRKTMEYKWLVNGEHYPALWVVTNVTGTTETVSQIRYRDHARAALSIDDLTPSLQALTAYPNPASDETTISLPNSWGWYVIEVFDVKGSAVLTQSNCPTIKTTGFAQGQYIVRVSSGINVGYAKILKQ